MGAVDKADMLCALYGVDKKSKKCLHRIFFGLVDRALCNAAIVYGKIHNKGMYFLISGAVLLRHSLLYPELQEEGLPQPLLRVLSQGERKSITQSWTQCDLKTVDAIRYDLQKHVEGVKFAQRNL